MKIVFRHEIKNSIHKLMEIVLQLKCDLEIVLLLGAGSKMGEFKYVRVKTAFSEKDSK